MDRQKCKLLILILAKITTRQSPLATRTSKWKKEIYITVVHIVVRLQIVMLDDTVLLRKNLVRFR